MPSTMKGREIVRMKTSLSISLLLILFASTRAQEKLGYLRTWVGKYPTYNVTKPHREFLKEPEIQRQLLSLLPRKVFHFLTVTCGKEVPIELIDEYLIIHRCHSNYCLRGTALLIVGLKEGIIHVALRTEKDSERRWFSRNGKYRELPFKVINGWIVLKNGA
jgi:hypothetical protein